MRLLLDTNVLIAVVDERLDALGRAQRDALLAADAVLHASVASLWEIVIKVRLGKLALTVSPATLPMLFESMGMAILAIEYGHVLTDIRPEPPTRDPFDRLLLAQCQHENLRLLTRDRALLGHPMVWTPSA